MKRKVEDWIAGRGPKLDLIDEVLQRVLADEGLYCGRMISQSKSTYCLAHPDHLVFFNACIFIKRRYTIVPWPRYEYQQVWWGDLDVTLDLPALEKAANLRKESLYVCRETFSWEGLTDKIIKENEGNVYIVRPCTTA